MFLLAGLLLVMTRLSIVWRATVLVFRVGSVVGLDFAGIALR